MNDLFMLLLASIPIIWLIIALNGLKLSGDKACIGALIISSILAYLKWDMSIKEILTAALEGGIFALWPIIIVIIAAIFTYNITLHTGAMDTIKQMVAGVTRDKRVLVLIIGWCFGGFMEGMAGFGTAVAIPASMLWALGVAPLPATLACLISNSLVTAFGSIGIPTISLAQVGGLEIGQLTWATVVQMAPIMLIIPFIMIIIVGGSFKSLKGVGHIALVSALSFIIPQFIIAKYMGPEMVVVVGSIISLLCTVWIGGRNKAEVPEEYRIEQTEEETLSKDINLKEGFIAWSPYILIFTLLLVTSKVIPIIHEPLAKIKSTISVYAGENPEILTFQWIIAPGVLIFISALIGGSIQGASPSELFRILGESIKQMFKTMITIISVLATAKVMGYSGMVSTIAVILVSITGSFYPLISPIIGALGTFVTGSGTSANVLFGGMQVEAAASIGANPHWLAATNTIGAGIGKTISPQCIALGVSTTGLVGKEGEILSGILKWTILMLVIACIISGFFNILIV